MQGRDGLKFKHYTLAVLKWIHLLDIRVKISRRCLGAGLALNAKFEAR